MRGVELRFLRKQLGMTQAALARKMRVSDQTIANYEKENTSIPGRRISC
ncbi:MAG: helix-turn-helix domain-containing protein [Methyloceanibacter sp.]